MLQEREECGFKGGAGGPRSSLGLLLGEVCTCAPGQALLCELQLRREL